MVIAVLNEPKLSSACLTSISKLENKINKLVTDMGFDFIPIEWDIVPEEKMWEILAYRAPTQISNWKFGRDYEKQRTPSGQRSKKEPGKIYLLPFSAA